MAVSMESIDPQLFAESSQMGAGPSSAASQQQQQQQQHQQQQNSSNVLRIVYDEDQDTFQELSTDEGGGEEEGEGSDSSEFESGSEYEESEEDRADQTAADAAEDAGSQDQDSLDKLVNSIFRGTNRDALLNPTGAAGALGETWDQSIKDVLDDLEADEAERSLRAGRKRTKRRHMRSRQDAPLSHECQSMLSAANAAYMTRDYDNAVSLLHEIIRIEPNSRKAYGTLSAIHTDLGNTDKSLQLDILSAHMAGKDPELWKDLGARSRDLMLREQAVYCFTQALSWPDTREDVESLWDRSVLLADLGHLRRAANGFLQLLRMHPNDPDVVRQLVPVLVGQGEALHALSLLQDVFADQTTKYPDGPQAAAVQPMGTAALAVSDLRDLVELHKSAKQYRDAISCIRTGQRWLQGRTRDQQAWEEVPDDREYDHERKSRPGWKEDERLRRLEALPKAELDPILRGNLAVCRLLTGNKAEADVHCYMLRSCDIYEHAALFGELADVYFDKKHYDAALELYQDLGECDMTNTPAVWAKIALCNRHLGNLEGAEECFTAVISSDPDELSYKLQLAELYDEMDRREEALELVNEVLYKRRLLRQQEMQARYQQSDQEQAALESGVLQPVDGLFPEQRQLAKPPPKQAKRKVTREQRLQAEAQRQADIELGFDRLSRIEQEMADPLSSVKSKEWIDAASYLVDSFRETPALFPSDRKRKYKNIIPRNVRIQREQMGEDLDADADHLAARLERGLADDEADAEGHAAARNPEDETFCGVNFDDWLKLAISYAFALTVNGEHTEADQVLRHLSTSTVNTNPPHRPQAIWLALATCFLQTGEFENASFEIRNVLKAHQCSSEVLRVMQAVFASGHNEWIGWGNVNQQKFVLRQVKIFDKAANVGPAAHSRITSPTGDDDDGDEEGLAHGGGDFKRSKVDPYFLSQYANVLLASRSYSSSIFYYIRLLELHPTDPLLNLVAGIAYILRSTQRQTDNRHYMIAQGFACLSQYRKARDDPAEVNYNFGRAFQQLSLYSLAMRHYELVLNEARTRQKQGLPELQGGLARFTAYNLHHLYLASGSPTMAKRVSDEWLAL